MKFLIQGWISGGEQFLEKPLHERALGHEGRNDSGFISPEVAGATSQHNMHAEFQGDAHSPISLPFSLSLSLSLCFI